MKHVSDFLLNFQVLNNITVFLFFLELINICNIAANLEVAVNLQFSVKNCCN